MKIVRRLVVVLGASLVLFAAATFDAQPAEANPAICAIACAAGVVVCCATVPELCPDCAGGYGDCYDACLLL